MTCLKGYDNSKVWFRFSKTINGKNLRFRWEQLPKHRLEEFIDFKMNYYVKHELTHIVSGVTKSPDAMAEYREIMLNQHRNDPTFYPSICCVDDETNEMVAYNCVLLYRRGEIFRDIMPAQTAELKEYYKMIHEWNQLCRISDVINKYKVDTIFEDDGFAIHPDYRGYRITSSFSLLRQIVCMAYGVPMTGAWMTNIRIQSVSHREGWDTVFEIGSEEMEKKLGIKFQTAPPTIVYRAKTVG